MAIVPVPPWAPGLIFVLDEIAVLLGPEFRYMGAELRCARLPIGVSHTDRS